MHYSFSILGRLLKAFQIDFNWYHLASWINITEQWPFRTSWLILHYDMYEESLDDNMSLKSLYDKYVNLIYFLILGVQISSVRFPNMAPAVVNGS